MSASSGPGDADEELIPRLVKELVLPLAQHAVADVWNPASRRQSKAAAAMLADLLVYVPPDDSKMQVRTCLHDAVCVDKGGKDNPDHCRCEMGIRMPIQYASRHFAQAMLGAAATVWHMMSCHAAHLLCGDSQCVCFLQSCLMEVRERLEQAAEQLHLPPWPAAAAQAHPPACAILARRFGRGLRILAAVAAFEGVLAREHLIAIALDKLINRQVCFCSPVMPFAAAHSISVPTAHRH